MNKQEFAKLAKALEYLAADEVVREIRSTRNYNIKRYQNYCSEKDVKFLAEKAKYDKQTIKEGWFKDLSAKEIIDLAKNYKTNYNYIYTHIYCFYMNYYKSQIGLVKFTEDEKNWYKSEAQKIKVSLITE